MPKANAAALRFYLRLGFMPIENSGIGMRLEWRDPCHSRTLASGSGCGWNGVTRATRKRRRDVHGTALPHKPQNILHHRHVFRGDRAGAPGALDENAVDKGWVVLQAFHLGADRAKFGHREIG